MEDVLNYNHLIHRWDDQPIRCDESRPEELHLPKGARRIWFANPTRSTFDDDLLRRSILAQPSRGDIEGVSIEFGSQMVSPWVVALFPQAWDVVLRGQCLENLSGLESVRNLRTLQIDTSPTSRRSLDVLPSLPLKELTIRIGKKRDVENLAACRSLDATVISSWPFPELSKLGSFQTQFLSFSGGSLSSAEGLNCDRLRWLSFAGCKKLVRIVDIRVPWLQVNGCHSFQLESTGSIAGLKLLKIIDRMLLDSFDFAAACKELESLSILRLISTTRVTATDLSSIIRHPTLRSVWVDGLADEAVSKIAHARKDLDVSNGLIFYHEGERVSRDDYFSIRSSSGYR